MLANMMPIIAVLLAVCLFVLGMVFITNPAKGFELSGHEQASLPAVMGGRYVGLALIIGGLMWMQEYKALALAFAIGAGFGFFDAVVTRNAGGSPKGHVAAGVIAGMLAIFYAGFPVFEG